MRVWLFGSLGTAFKTKGSSRACKSPRTGAPLPFTQLLCAPQPSTAALPACPRPHGISPGISLAPSGLADFSSQYRIHFQSLIFANYFPNKPDDSLILDFNSWLPSFLYSIVDFLNIRTVLELSLTYSSINILSTYYVLGTGNVSGTKQTLALIKLTF